MTTIVEGRTPATEFALEDTLSHIADAQFDIERIVANGNDRMVSFVWATADDFETMDAALTADSSVENPELLHEDENARLYRME